MSVIRLNYHEEEEEEEESGKLASYLEKGVARRTVQGNNELDEASQLNKCLIN